MDVDNFCTDISKHLFGEAGENREKSSVRMFIISAEIRNKNFANIKLLHYYADSYILIVCK
jgi:hypothetical protein